jgi:hypothetical protein
MKRVHISFGDGKYKRSLDLLEKTSLENGTEKFIAYNKDWLFKTDFIQTLNVINIYLINQEEPDIGYGNLTLY